MHSSKVQSGPLMKAVPYILKRVGCITNLSAHGTVPAFSRKEAVPVPQNTGKQLCLPAWLLNRFHGNEASIFTGIPHTDTARRHNYISPEVRYVPGFS